MQIRILPGLKLWFADFRRAIPNSQIADLMFIIFTLTEIASWNVVAPTQKNRRIEEVEKERRRVKVKERREKNIVYRMVRWPLAAGGGRKAGGRAPTPTRRETRPSDTNQ
eukprot:scaffold51662_cov28-Tisochrysis_lutea.AAC.1